MNQTSGIRAPHRRVLLFDPTNAKSAVCDPLLEMKCCEWEVSEPRENFFGHAAIKTRPALQIEFAYILRILAASVAPIAAANESLSRK